MLAYVSTGPDFQIYVNEGRNDEGKLLAELPARVIVSLDLFNESREGFSWRGDSERTGELLSWLLEDAGYEIVDRPHFNRVMSRLCEPGGSQAGGYIFHLRERVKTFEVIVGFEVDATSKEAAEAKLRGQLANNVTSWVLIKSEEVTDAHVGP